MGKHVVKEMRASHPVFIFRPIPTLRFHGSVNLRRQVRIHNPTQSQADLVVLILLTA